MNFLFALIGGDSTYSELCYRLAVMRVWPLIGVLASTVIAQSSANNTPDWRDAFAPSTWSTWALVVVGLIAIIGAFFTLSAMRRQARIMQSQTTAANDNAASARASAEVVGKNIDMLISTERARLRVELKELSLVPKAPSIHTVDFIVSIYGLTPAFVTESGCTAYFRPLEQVGSTDAEPHMVSMFALPKIIPPNTTPFNQFTFLLLGSDDARSADLLREISEDRLFVEFRGFINYLDVFNNERETRFRYVWKFSSITPIGTTRFGDWEKCGASEDNKET